MRHLATLLCVCTLAGTCSSDIRASAGALGFLILASARGDPVGATWTRRLGLRFCVDPLLPARQCDLLS